MVRSRAAPASKSDGRRTRYPLIERSSEASAKVRPHPLFSCTASGRRNSRSGPARRSIFRREGHTPCSTLGKTARMRRRERNFQLPPSHLHSNRPHRKLDIVEVVSLSPRLVTSSFLPSFLPAFLGFQRQRGRHREPALRRRTARQASETFQAVVNELIRRRSSCRANDSNGVGRNQPFPADVG